MFGSPAMQLRETRGVFAKGCFVQYHLPEHARSDHIVKPTCLFWISGPVADHQSLTVSDIVIRSLHGWVPINPTNQLVGWCRHGPSESCRLSGHDWETSGFAPIVLKLWKLAIRIVEDLRKPAHCVRTDQKSEFYGFDADRDFSAALNILHRGLGMSLKPGGNAPARRENENDRVVLTLPTA